MQQHKLDASGWTFAFDRAKSRLGLANFKTKTISISRYMAEAATEDDIRQIMLHEIAHALLPISEGHGERWKNKLRDIGGTGSRLSKNPYVDKELAARRAARRNKKVSERNAAAKAASEAGITVDIGDVLKVRGKAMVTITRKARTRFYGIDQDGLEWGIPMSLAPSLKLAAQQSN